MDLDDLTCKVFGAYVHDCLGRTYMALESKYIWPIAAMLRYMYRS